MLTGIGIAARIDAILSELPRAEHLRAWNTLTLIPVEALGNVQMGHARIMVIGGRSLR